MQVALVIEDCTLTQNGVDSGIYNTTSESKECQESEKIGSHEKMNVKTATCPPLTGGYRLVYFNMRGRAELIRLLFKAAGVDFHDDRIEYADWPELKAQTPSGVLPYLVTPEGEVMVQSMAIARYLARKFDFYGSTEREVYLIERAIGQLHDLADEAFKVVTLPAEMRESQLEAFRAGIGKQMMSVLEKFLEENIDNSSGTTGGLDRPFYAGSRMSIADLFSVAVVDWLQFNFPDLLKPFVLLTDHYHCCLVDSPSVKSYLTNGTKTPM